jgi:hypothetical protein
MNDSFNWLRVCTMRAHRAGVLLLALLLLAIVAPPALRVVADAAYNPRYDVTGDGVVNVIDIQTVAGAWGTSGNAYDDRELIVAKNGGEYQTIGAAISAIQAAGDASASAPYVIRVLPGTYVESVTLPAYTHLLGSGEATTILSSAVGNASWPPTTATLVMGSQSRASGLTVINEGADDYNVAILVSNVEATLLHVTAQALNPATGRAAGLPKSRGVVPMAPGPESPSSDRDYYFGIVNRGSTAILNAENVSALAQAGYSSNFGLYNESGARAILRGGTYRGLDLGATYGINNSGSGTTVVAESVSAEGSGGSTFNYGLNNVNSAIATLRGGTYSGQEGTTAAGVYNSAASLTAESINALGQDSLNANYGLNNVSSAIAIVTFSSLEGEISAVNAESGSVTLSLSELKGGAVSGSASCSLVLYNGTQLSSTCTIP